MKDKYFDIDCGVISLGPSTFNSCNKLKTINYKGDKEKWDIVSKKLNTRILEDVNINFIN